MSSTPTALILDFGGVLTTDLWASVRACARREGLDEDTLLDLLSKDPEIHPLFMQLERGEVSQPDFEAELAAAAGLPPDGLLGRMCADLRPDEAMLTAVAALRQSGAQIGILSNTWGTGYFNPYEGYDLEDRADVLILSDQVRLRKPEKGIFQMMLDRLSVKAHGAVFVDDVAGHLPTAATMGLTVVHHIRTSDTLTELERLFAG
jgi:putative hydrolase of the HAD superfamily